MKTDRVSGQRTQQHYNTGAHRPGVQSPIVWTLSSSNSQFLGLWKKPPCLACILGPVRKSKERPDLTISIRVDTKEGGHNKGTTQSGDISSKPYISFLHFPYQTQCQMLLLMEIRQISFISRKGSAGVSIATVTFRMLDLRGHVVLPLQLKHKKTTVRVWD